MALIWEWGSPVGNGWRQTSSLLSVRYPSLESCWTTDQRNCQSHSFTRANTQIVQKDPVLTTENTWHNRAGTAETFGAPSVA